MKAEIQTKVAEYEQLLEKAHTLGTELREQVRQLPPSDQQVGLSWRMAQSVEHVTTAQTYGLKFRHFVNNHLKEEEV